MKILVISTVFHPFPGVGAVRVSNWARMFIEEGWETCVIARDYGYGSDFSELKLAHRGKLQVRLFDQSAQEISGKTRSHVKSNSTEQSRLAKIIKKSREISNRILVPDGQILFWMRMLPKIRKIAQEFQPDLVLTSSPQHSIHLVGRHLKKKINIPWVADFRDPYTIDPRFNGQSFWSPLIIAHRCFEKKIYLDATRIIHAIPMHGRWAKSRFKEHSGKCFVLPHVVPKKDDELPEPIEPNGAKNDPATCWIKIVGTYDTESLANLALAVKRLAATMSGEKAVMLRIVGNIPENYAYLKKISGGRVEAIGRVVHERALQEINTADILISILSEERSKVLGVSSKLFEYAATGKPIIAVRPTRPDRMLLKKIGNAVILEKTSTLDFHDALKKITGEESMLGTFGQDKCVLQQFRWAQHKQNLVECLSKVVLGHLII